MDFRASPRCSRGPGGSRRGWPRGPGSHESRWQPGVRLDPAGPCCSASPGPADQRPQPAAQVRALLESRAECPSLRLSGRVCCVVLKEKLHKARGPLGSQKAALTSCLPTVRGLLSRGACSWPAPRAQCSRAWADLRPLLLREGLGHACTGVSAFQLAGTGGTGTARLGTGAAPLRAGSDGGHRGLLRGLLLCLLLCLWLVVTLEHGALSPSAVLPGGGLESDVAGPVLPPTVLTQVPRAPGSLRVQR